jgi:AcrR family transcriptional regulator
LSKDRVLRGALAIADTGGLGALTIRSLAQELGVKPMSVYYHVANKDEILDGLVDIVFSEIELPSIGGEWRSEMRRRAHSARSVLRSHRWAIGLLESRPTPGPATLRHHDVVLGTLRAAGFSREMTAHAYALIDSYTYGFALQEASLPFEATGAVTAEVADPVVEQLSTGELPHMADMVSEYYLRPGYTFGDEFDFGLGLILDALDAALPTGSVEPPPPGRLPGQARKGVAT